MKNSDIDEIYAAYQVQSHTYSELNEDESYHAAKHKWRMFQHRAGSQSKLPICNNSVNTESEYDTV